MYCTLIPKAKNGNDSLLFQDLNNKFKNRTITKSIYATVTNEKFLKLFGDTLLYDQNGEPVLESILKYVDLDKALQKEAKYEAFAEYFNTKQYNNCFQMVEDVIKFNSENNGCVAIIEIVDKYNSRIKVVPETEDSLSQKKQLENSYKVYQKIDKILKDLGLSISFLDSDLYHIESGLMTPEGLENSVDGLAGVINIANSFQGYTILTEEFAHFVIENIKNSQLVQRAETFLNENPEVLQQILGNDYDNVVKYYTDKNKQELVVREALGRLMADTINEQNEIPVKHNLFTRVKEAIKSFINKTFRLKNDQQIRDFNSLRENMSEIAKEALNNKLINKRTLEYFKRYGDSLAHAENEAKKISDKISDVQTAIVANMIKFLNIYEESKDITVIDDIKEQFKTTTEALYKNTFANAITSYLNDIIKIIKLQKDELMKISITDNLNVSVLRNYAHTLVQTKNLIESYRQPLLMLRQLCAELTSEESEQPGLTKEMIESIHDLAVNTNNILDKTEDFYMDIQKKTLIQLCKPFFNGGKEYTIPSGINKGKVINIETILDQSMGDISIFNRMVLAAHNTDDMFVGLVDAILQDGLEEARANTVKDDHNIQAFDKAYKNSAGYTGYDFMFEKNKDGKATGRYISEYDFITWQRNRGNYAQSLKDQGHDEEYIRRAMIAWDEENSETFELKRDVWFTDENGRKQKKEIIRKYKVPKKELYPSNDLSRLNKDQKAYYDAFMQKKWKLDFMLPENQVHPFKAVQMMIASTGEAILNSDNGFIGGIENAFKAFKDNYLSITENDNGEFFNDTDSGFKQFINKLLRRVEQQNEKDVVYGRTKFDKTPYMKVPTYFLRELEEMGKLSKDATSTIREYSIMANHYSSMHKLIDTMELIKEQNKARKIMNVNYGKQLIEQLSYGNVTTETESELNTQTTEIYKRVNNLIDTLLYSQSKQQGKRIYKDLTTGKLADDLIKYTSFSLLGYNAFSGINNVVIAKYQMFIEASGGKYFNRKDWLRADSEYMTKLLPDFLAELHTPYAMSKMALIGEMFNVGQHWKDKIKNSKSYKGSTHQFLSNFGSSFMLEAGEHHIQMSTALAFLIHYKLYDDNKSVSLYDAIDVQEKKDKNGKLVETRLVLKDEYKNYKKADGSKFSFFLGSDDIKKLSLLIGKINQDMHGIYNKEDAPEIKRYAVGRMLMMFRNHIVPQIQKRWKTLGKFEGIYNYRSGEYEEGYMVTAIRFLLDLVRPLGEDQNVSFVDKMRLVKSQLTEEQQSNLRKARNEIIALLVIALATAFIAGGFDDDDDNVWLKRQFSYYLRRLKLEAEFPYKPISEGMTILVSPSAVISPLQRVGRIFQNVGTFNQELKTGPYKGHSPLYASVMRAFPVIPQVKDFVFIDEDNRRFAIFKKGPIEQIINLDEE